MNKLPEISDKDIGTIFKTVGMTLLSTVGGVGGPLYGTLFLQAGMKTAGKMELSLADWTEAVDAALSGIVMRGKAQVGDKTMVDALTPALNSLKVSVQENCPFHEALDASAEAAKKGMEERFLWWRVRTCQLSGRAQCRAPGPWRNLLVSDFESSC